MTALEFPLAQGWTRGITLGFENAEGSKNYNFSKTFHTKQVHGNVVKNITCLKPQEFSAQNVEADGLMCDGEWLRESSFRIAVKTADCLPLLYVEREKKKLCAIHAGWRGLQKKIHLWPFESGEFTPEQTWVWVGPSLNGKDFCVRSDMWTLFDARTQSDQNVFSNEGAESKEVKFFYPWKLLEKDFAKLKVELVYNVEINTFSTLEWASYRRWLKTEAKAYDPLAPVSYPVPRSQNISWIGV